MRDTADRLKTVLADDGGATLVEYALVVALIAGVCIALLAAIGGNIQSIFSKVANVI